MRTTKLLSLIMVLIMPLFMVSCDKDDELIPENFAAGEIPGLGSADGELTGIPFTLPSGVTLIKEITGAGNYADYWSQSHGDEVRHYFGSGRGYVDLLIPLRNSNSGNITVTFPAGTIIRSKSNGYQHGVLIKKVTISIPANSDYYLSLSLYCGNEHRGSAGSSTIYEWAVVSNASLLIDLCERIKNKKINIEEFSPTSADDYRTCSLLVSTLQRIVWRITDGKGLTESDIEYINSLPNS